MKGVFGGHLRAHTGLADLQLCTQLVTQITGDRSYSIGAEKNFRGCRGPWKIIYSNKQC